MIDPQSHGWLNGLQEAVWLIDGSNLLILHANAAAERLAGRPAAAMVGVAVLRLASTHFHCWRWM